MSFRSLHVFLIFQKNIKTCQVNELNQNDYCLKSSSNCFKQHYVLTRGGFRTFNKKIDCECDKMKMYSFKCGNYCSLSEKHCSLLNMNIDYFNEIEKNNTLISEIKNCNF